jgi:hypothetical protein
MASRVERLMTFFDDGGMSLDEFYHSRAVKAVQMVSPTLDGKNTELTPIDELAKAALDSSVAGAINAVYDLAVITQYAMGINAVGATPKKPWRRQGFRAWKTASKTSGLGVAESQALGTALSPTPYEVAPTAKELELVGAFSSRLKLLSEIADGVAADDMRRAMEADFWRSLENDININYDTLPGNNMSGLNLLTASDGETTAESYTAGDEDYLGVDRSVETWFNGNPLYAASGTDRDLSMALINDMREAAQPYWSSLEGKWWLTGFDTWTRISELEGAKIRLSFESYKVTLGDGIQVGPGIQAGGKIATFDGFPMVVSDAVSKVGDTISPVMLLDNVYLGMYMGRPVQHVESDDVFAVGHLVKGVWYGIGELIDMKPKTTSRLRDLR